MTGPTRRGSVAALAVACIALAACSGSSDPESAPTPASTLVTDQGAAGDQQNSGDDGQADSSERPSPDAAPGDSTGDATGDATAGSTGDAASDSTVVDGTPTVPTTTNPPRPTEGPDAPPTTGVGPTTTLAAPQPPEPADLRRIVSLSATHTETLFALGAGDLLVAVDVDSDFPAEAQALQELGLTDSLSMPDPIAALDPDLVIVGADPTRYADRLIAAGLTVWRGPEPDDVEGAFDQILELGGVVGRGGEAADLVETMRDELGALSDAIPSGATYFHEQDPSIFTIVPGAWLDAVYGALGLENAVPPGGGGRDGGGRDYIRLQPSEVAALDPDVLILADAACCGITPERVASRSGWATVSAVESGAIASLPDRLAERWGVSLRELWRIVGTAAAAADA